MLRGQIQNNWNIITVSKTHASYKQAIMVITKKTNKITRATRSYVLLVGNFNIRMLF